MLRCESHPTHLWHTMPDERSHIDKMHINHRSRLHVTSALGTAVTSSFQRFLLRFAQKWNAARRRRPLLNFTLVLTHQVSATLTRHHITFVSVEGRREEEGIFCFSHLQSGRCTFLFLFFCERSSVWKKNTTCSRLKTLVSNEDVSVFLLFTVSN